MTDYLIPKAVDLSNMGSKVRKQFDHELSAGHYVATPKFDGCAVAIDLDTGAATSATGKPVRSIPHIVDQVLSRLSGGVLYGEVWQPDTAFQEISGKFRRHSEQPELELRVWDFNVAGGPHVPVAWKDRMYRARNRLMGLRDVFVPYGVPVCSMQEAEAIAQAHVSRGGYDGAVLSNLYAPFRLGRSTTEHVKVKPLLELDLLCTGYEKAVGEKTGRPTVALVLRGRSGPVKVATGLDHAQQAAPEQFLGRIVTVQAMGLTAGGALREPRFVGVRDDKLEPDY